MAPKFESSNAYGALSRAAGSSSTVNAVAAKKKKEEKMPVLEDWESFEG
jgi:hypothetical protein